MHPFTNVAQLFLSSMVSCDLFDMVTFVGPPIQPLGISMISFSLVVTEVGTRWTLPLTVAVLHLPFLNAAYCSPSIVSLVLLSRPLSSSGLLFFLCHCSRVAIVLTVPIVLLFQ
jgi:hypothetical protein